MSKKRKNYRPGRRVEILKKHLVDKVNLSNLCDRFGLHPTMLYRIINTEISWLNIINLLNPFSIKRLQLGHRKFCIRSKIREGCNHLIFQPHAAQIEPRFQNQGCCNQCHFVKLSIW